MNITKLLLTTLFIFYSCLLGIGQYSGKKLKDGILNGQVTFTVIEGGKHNNLIDFEEYHLKLDEILK